MTKDMLAITSVLDGIRARGVAVLLVHHHGKSSTERQNVGHKARGTSVLPGWYDSHFSLEWANAAAKTSRLKFELRHGESPEDKVLRLNHALQFEELMDELSQIDMVVSVVEELGSATREEVAERCNRTARWAGGYLKKAVDEGRLVEGRLVATGNRPIMYTLPEMAPVTVKVPTPSGEPIVIFSNTAQSGGVRVDGGPWYDRQ